MIEYKIEMGSFIGGWFIDKKICDNIISHFKNTPSFYKVSGKTYGGKKFFETIPKKSTELVIEPNLRKPPFDLYEDNLQKCLNLYTKKYEGAKRLSRYGLMGKYNIQHYKPGEGFYEFHCERAGWEYSDRQFVFMTFLNDVKDGGTIFKYQNLTVPAKKGLTLIWPTDWTHLHKGQISKKHEKYIVTGWLHFVKGEPSFVG